ncbi:hypothetical protein IFU39_00120 [Paenibacillus sp. CFBP 13594]|uniref:hypothetical protein n=1 Tax=Paenibacillus sp. CFBP 13594 TaxID=2774037 RepID=UPI00177F9D1A|nr:hypothetical protein [Paenibacillus sp. CFBP 13594]MBD8836223.1 hypothetical protein [Paenibacillus sp. CFBP 13594]
MYVEISESDFMKLDSSEEATHVKILAKLREMPVTIEKLYEMKVKKYANNASVDSETYIVDDNGRENFSFWICCKKEFFKIVK